MAGFRGVPCADTLKFSDFKGKCRFDGLSLQWRPAGYGGSMELNHPAGPAIGAKRWYSGGGNWLQRGNCGHYILQRINFLTLRGPDTTGDEPLVPEKVRIHGALNSMWLDAHWAIYYSTDTTAATRVHRTGGCSTIDANTLFHQYNAAGILQNAAGGSETAGDYIQNGYGDKWYRLVNATNGSAGRGGVDGAPRTFDEDITIGSGNKLYFAHACGPHWGNELNDINLTMNVNGSVTGGELCEGAGSDPCANAEIESTRGCKIASGNWSGVLGSNSIPSRYDNLDSYVIDVPTEHQDTSGTYMVKQNFTSGGEACAQLMYEAYYTSGLPNGASGWATIYAKPGMSGHTCTGGGGYGTCVFNNDAQTGAPSDGACGELNVGYADCIALTPAYGKITKIRASWRSFPQSGRQPSGAPHAHEWELWKSTRDLTNGTDHTGITTGMTSIDSNSIFADKKVRWHVIRNFNEEFNVGTPYYYRYGEQSSTVDYTVTIKDASNVPVFDDGGWSKLVFQMNGLDTCRSGSYSVSQFEITLGGVTTTYAGGLSQMAMLLYVKKVGSDYFYTYRWHNGSGINYISRDDVGTGGWSGRYRGWEFNVGAGGSDPGAGTGSHNFYTANSNWFDDDNLVAVPSGEFKIRIHQVAHKNGACYGGIHNHSRMIKYL